MPEQWRKWPLFDNIFRLSGVPVITVQLRYNGWVTEMQDPAAHAKPFAGAGRFGGHQLLGLLLFSA